MGGRRRTARAVLTIALAAGACGVMVGTTARPAAAAIGVPQGFTATTLTSGQFFAPTLFTFTPAGDVLVSQQTGKIKLFKNGSVTNFLSLTVASATDRGILGTAFDPAFPSAPYIYVYYHRPSPSIHGVISRFTVQGDQAVAASEQVIYTMDDLKPTGLHTGGVMEFGLDGKLYVSVGDDARGTEVSQSLSSDQGKILRINKDGSIPTDNPFSTTASGKYRSIWALGLRNPYTWAFDATGRMLVSEVGLDTWEELNRGARGANYGWPTVSGDAHDPRFVDPVFVYRHGTEANEGCAVIGGDFADAGRSAFPSTYDGSYFFADYCNGWLRAYDLATDSIRDFATGIESPTHMRFGPDGQLYVLTRGQNGQPSTLIRIAYTGSASALPSIVTQPADVTASVGSPASFSVEAQGQAPLAYQWFRNGAALSGATTSTYTLASTVLADDGATFSVRVSNSLGQVTSRSAVLRVSSNRPPVPTITSPSTTATYAGGTVVNYAGTATDPEDGALPASAFDWEIDFHHDTHVHPFLDPPPGSKSGSFQAPVANFETAANVWFRIYLTVTDPAGNTTTIFRDVHPRTVTIKLLTLPAGGRVTIDGSEVAAPVTITGVAGMQRTIAPVSPVTIAGKTWVFDSWSDFGAGSHVIAPPGGSATYIAVYRLSTGSVGTGTGLRATYFNQVTLTSPVVTRIDPVVMLDVGANGRPAPGVAPGTYSVRWEGTLQAQFSENYTFVVTADDGVRLWVNNRLVIDRWGPRSRQTYTSAPIALTAAAKVPLKVEFRQGSGRSGFIRLFWQSPSTPKSIVPSAQLYAPT
jgi:glucose/arabinose dehydrogenase